MSIDQAVILARGLGTRMKRADDEAQLQEGQAAVAQTGVKAMIPIDRPFLDYVLTVLADTGFRRICLVIGPEHDLLREYYGQRVRPRRLSFEFAVQQQPRGTADAVLAAEAFAGDSAFVMLNSDNYYPPEALAALRDASGPAVALFNWQSMVSDGNIAEERLRQFAIGQIDSQGCLSRILEKPDEATWNALPRPLWISMNCWRFGPEIFQACRSIGPSARGEYEVTDAAQYTIDVLGQHYQAMKVSSAVLDLSSRKDVAPVAARLAGKRVDL